MQSEVCEQLERRAVAAKLECTALREKLNVAASVRNKDMNSLQRQHTAELKARRQQQASAVTSGT